MIALDSPLARRAWIAAQIVFVALALWYLGRSLHDQWGGVQHDLRALDPRWSGLVLSGVLVFIAYGVLIQTWRLMLRAWNANLSFADATRIFFISNLGKYVPGKIWQITAMSAMAERSGVSMVAAAGSSLIVNLVNVITGFIVVFATGFEVLRAQSVNAPRTALAITVVLVLGAASLPLLLPYVLTIAGRVLRRPMPSIHIPARALLLAAAGTTAAWILYGVAFAIFCGSLLPERATGGVLSYIAVFTGSYLVGYLVVAAPGGLGPREAMLKQTMPTFGLVAVESQALVIAFSSRLWLTVLEVLPGLLLLAYSGLRRRPTHDIQP